jgi:hypothetical protein
MQYLEFLFKAKYHYSIMARMFDNYEKFPDKRIIIGVVNESAKTVSNMIKALLFYENRLSDNFTKNIENFKRISGNYFSEEVCENLLKILDIEKESKISPVEFQKDEKIIFLINGKYKILTIDRLRTLTKTIKMAFFDLPRERQL